MHSYYGGMDVLLILGIPFAILALLFIGLFIRTILEEEFFIGP